MTAGYLPAVCIALAGALVVGHLWERLIKPPRPRDNRAIVRELERHKR